MTATRARVEAEEALLDAAERLLVSVGHASITTRLVAQEAGVNHGLVHYYFGSMENLLLRVLERFTDELIERHDQRRLIDDPDLPVDDVRQLRERRHAVLRAGLRNCLLGPLRDLRRQLRAELLHRGLDIEMGVPDLEVLHAREGRHRGPVGADRVKHDPLPILDRVAVVDRGDAGIDTIVAVRHPAPQDKDRTIAVVSPCGACRELIFDYDPKARVIVPNGKSPSIVPIGELLPNKYTRGPER